LKFNKKDMIRTIYEIREDIGHKKVKIDVKDVIVHENTNDLLIITPDRPEKSAIIGKGGWVVGKLKEELEINSIHVEAYSDILIRKYRIKQSINTLDDIIKMFNNDDAQPLENLKNLLNQIIKNIYNIYKLDIIFDSYDNNLKELKEHKSIVALSGGVDSSFSLIIAEKMGFNPIAATVDPGTIILPPFFKKNIDKLCNSLKLKHEYLKVEMDLIITGSMEGRFHPCGRCSNMVEKTLMTFTRDKKIPFLIYGDLVSTGSQSILYNNGIVRINLPAMLSVTKQEIQRLTTEFGVIKKGVYGCPLLNEVHKKYPHMRKFSIQRVLRETRAGLLEPGEALEMIMRII